MYKFILNNMFYKININKKNKIYIVNQNKL